MIVIVSLFGGLSSVLGVKNPGIKDFLMFFLGPIVLFVFASLFILSTFLYLKTFRPEALNRNVYTFTHWGMEFTGFPRDVSLPWRQFVKLKETRSYILLYSQKDNHEAIHLLQKKMFSGKQEMEEFKKFASKQLPL